MTLVAIELYRWLVEDEDVEGVHGVLVRHHQCLISRLLVEAVGVTANAIAQAGIAGRQEDPSNLQRFRAHHPPTLKREETRW